MKLFNTHLHTCCSHDSSETIENHYNKALSSPLFGFAVTDHCDCEYSDNPSVFENISKSFISAEKAKSGLIDGFVISSGVEIGDALFAPEFADNIISSFNFDVILGSVHAVRIENWDMPFSTISFEDKSDAFIDEYLKCYFNDLSEMLDSTDFDVLSHLTVPLRYIVGKYGRQINIKNYYPAIESILQKIIKTGKTLEVNTSNYSSGNPFFMPDENIIDMYLKLGGKDITLGSDAHVADNIYNGFDKAAEILKVKGINKLVFYVKREKKYYSI